MMCVLCQLRQFEILFYLHKNWKMGKCCGCGLVQVVPMPTVKEIRELYHEDLEHFEPYIDQLSVHHAYFKQKVEEIRSRSANGRFLDIGCAMGVLLEEARSKGFKVEGIDLSADAVDYCTKKKLSVYNGTVYSVKKLKEGSYDVITAFQIIEHERDPVKMMRRVYKLLKKDGLVVLATPNQGGIWQKLMGRRWFGYRHPEHVVLLDFNTMRKLLEVSGFTDIEILRDSPRPFPLSFALKRAGDYFPLLSWILKPLGAIFDHFKIVNPINPWDDMIVFAKK